MSESESGEAGSNPAPATKKNSAPSMERCSFTLLIVSADVLLNFGPGLGQLLQHFLYSFLSLDDDNAQDDRHQQQDR